MSNRRKYLRALRAYKARRSGMLTLALAIKASDQLHGVIDELTCVVKTTEASERTT